MIQRPKWTRVRLGLLLFVVLFLVFASLVSQQRDRDGPLQDTERVTNGQIDPSARHILYTCIGVPYYRLWRQLGYTGDAAYPLQLLNAVSGALGATGSFVFFVRLVGKPHLALLLASAYAFSYGHWYFTEDVFYNVFTFVPLIWSLPLLHTAATTSNLRRRLILALGLAGLSTAAILGTQEHALFVGVILCGLLLNPSTVSWKARLLSAAGYGLGIAVLLLPAYATLASRVACCKDLECVVNWLRPYGMLLPMYGVFSWDRIPAAIRSFLATIVPLGRGMALRQLATGIITPGKLLPQSALAATLFSLFATSVLLLMHRKLVWRNHRYTLLLSVVWILLYTPAIIWLDPFGPERWTVPLIPVLMLVATCFDIVTSSLVPQNLRRVDVVGGIVVLLIFLSNLTQAIWPDHHDPNPEILAAQYAATQMSGDDVMISPVWDWTAYLESQGHRTLSLLTLSLYDNGRNPDPDRLLRELDQVIINTQTAGGRVFLVDVFVYGPSEWAWITQNSGLCLEHFARYQLQPAWEFNGEQVWLITLVEEN